MTDDRALLDAIRADPSDDGPRLAYADWLEEHGTAQRAEFIRLQCELAKRSEDAADEVTKQLRDRQWQLLKAQEKKWLGPAARVQKKRYFYVNFRRGFVESCQMAAPLVLEQGPALQKGLPVWREAVLSRALGLVGQLVTVPVFGQLRHLTFAGPLGLEDARALAEWSGLAELEALRFWGGDEREHDRDVCRILAGSSHVGKLGLLEMIQVRGGIGSGQTDPDGAPWARRLEKQIKGRLGRPVFRVSRPFERTFPVKSSKWYGFYAGTLPRKRQGLLALDVGNTLLVAVFDARGNFLEEQQLSLEGILQQPPEEQYLAVNDAELHEYLRREFGFRPGLVRVKEFGTSRGLSVHLLPHHYQEYVEAPDAMTEESWGQEDVDHWPLSIQGWIDRGDFVLDWGNDYYLDSTGEVTSS